MYKATADLIDNHYRYKDRSTLLSLTNDRILHPHIILLFSRITVNKHPALHQVGELKAHHVLEGAVMFVQKLSHQKLSMHNAAISTRA